MPKFAIVSGFREGFREGSQIEKIFTAESPEEAKKMAMKILTHEDLPGSDLDAYSLIEVREVEGFAIDAVDLWREQILNAALAAANQFRERPKTA